MIRIVAETGSTNADLLAAAGAGAPEGTWLRAERQTAGQGRLGRVWQSAAGNLHASTIIRPLPGDPPTPTLALVAGVALQEAVAVVAPQVRLKWPNDLMAGTAKLAGILLQTGGEAVVAGFGVNLAHGPDGVGRATTSIAALSGNAPDPDMLLAMLADSVARWLSRWRSAGLAPVRARWLERAHPVGTPLRSGDAEGLFAGLDSSGALLLRSAGGTLVTISAGDIELM